MSIEILVDADEFWQRLSADMAAAKEQCYIQTMSYEGDATGQMVGQALIDSPAKDKRLIADDFYVRGKVSDKWLRSPFNILNREVRRERAATLALFDRMRSLGIGVTIRNPQGVIHQNFFNRNHKKIYACDDVVYVGGINVSDHNFEWHDMMVRIDDAAVSEFLKGDFRASFEGKDLNTSQVIGDVEVFRFDGRTNRKTWQPIFDMIAGAKESIEVISPYITMPFYDYLRVAKRNGVRIRVIAPEHNNYKSFQQYTEWESIRNDMDLRMYTKSMSHLKAMLIDDEALIVGSSNFDKMSVVFMQELVVVIRNKSVIEEFKRKVLEPDLEHTFKKTHHHPTWKIRYHIARFYFLIGLFSWWRSLTDKGGKA